MNRKLLGTMLALGVVWMGLASGYAPATAGPLALPPRPTVAPTAFPALKGAAITLRVLTPTSPGWWTGVEWQDAAGNWHPVEGWQGTLEADQTKTWWVAAADGGKGPFRWVISDRRGGEVRAISSAFNLPVSNRRVESNVLIER